MSTSAAPDDDRLIPTAVAAERLGIRPDTLYAYVSRGLIRSHKRDGQRGSFFDPADLDALARRGRGPEPRPDAYIESAITLIEDGRYWYRGHDAIDLASRHDFETISEFLWTGQLPDGPTEPWTGEERGLDAALTALTTLPASARTIERVRLAIAASAPHDHFRTDLRPSAVVDTAKRLIATTLAALPTRSELRDPEASIAARVWAVLCDRVPGRTTAGDDDLTLVDFAMGVMADHELAASTSAVRIAASFRANPHHVVAAGLGALSGAYHGGASRDVGRLLDEALESSASEVVGAWLGEGRRIPGLGQSLYPDGDPRATALLDRLSEAYPDDPSVAVTHELATIAADRGLPAPNVDFGLAVLGRALGLASDASESIMALARFSGWIAHAIEEYEDRSNLRLRAVYSGPRPDTTG